MGDNPLIGLIGRIEDEEEDGPADPEEEADRLAALKAQKLTYAIITHSPQFNNPCEPSHVTVVFVNRDYKCVASIDLAENVTALRSKQVKVEEVDDRLVVALRKDVAKRKGASA